MVYGEISGGTKMKYPVNDRQDLLHSLPYDASFK